ncbi:sulfate/molybdate ABC transporter ATP-binding protein [Caulobacter sp. 17J65-9]|uniref:sulfate/molybdate ABC transporter ATP-binding protein n=1 Tax=Caulobacter sp. 17J65-9 TaxID=2709382 RepID=UPI0013CA1080|nr:sulfate/molybdate ABC transporter ATP-binding protein [Caulobacter sp. 17J65-9]NEX92978.1 sulfate/molybdate ABC transporter ATP-binding protein [Caulobacter sp. 17J65-9]
MSLSVDNVSKRFGRFAALDRVSLQAVDGEFLALLGPSGSGKTSLLRVLAGLSRPDEGRVLFGGEDFLRLSPRERRVGMVFQHYALFRHMSVADNVAFGLRVRPRRQRPPRAEISARVKELLALVQLEGLEKRYPAQLSGGQRQRVALARALAIEPRMLLLDEPFGALDAKVRRELRRWLRQIHDETGVTTVFVTHDQEEAMDLADRVVVLNAGRVEQIGTPAELQKTPATAFVFDFLGDSNRLPCRVVDGHAMFEGGFSAPALGPVHEAAQATARFRPHEVDLAVEGGVPVTITHLSARGALIRAECQGLDGALYEVDLLRDATPASLAPGARVRLRPRRVFVFAETAR